MGGAVAEQRPTGYRERTTRDGERTYTHRGNVIVDIADMKMTGNAKDVLVTYALGSCLGVSLYDPVAGVAGLLHSMLPLAKIDPVKAKANPFMFVDVGMAAFLDAAYRMGAVRTRLVIKVAGGGQMMDPGGHFKIGKRNYTVLRKLLWKNGLLIAGEDVGGTESRTVFVHAGNGEVVIRAKGREVPL